LKYYKYLCIKEINDLAAQPIPRNFRKLQSAFFEIDMLFDM